VRFACGGAFAAGLCIKSLTDECLTIAAPGSRSLAESTALGATTSFRRFESRASTQAPYMPFLFESNRSGALGSGAVRLERSLPKPSTHPLRQDLRLSKVIFYR
jgi:hypothetical protein